MQRSITDEVIRQALIEYLAMRAPSIHDHDDLSDTTVRHCLDDYIAKRYGTHNSEFQEKQMQRLIVNVTAAMTELMRIQ